MGGESEALETKGERTQGENLMILSYIFIFLYNDAFLDHQVTSSICSQVQGDWTYQVDTAPVKLALEQVKIEGDVWVMTQPKLQWAMQTSLSACGARLYTMAYSP